MPGTTFHATRRRLVEMIRAHPDVDEDRVFYAPIAPEHRGAECIFFASTQGEASSEVVTLKVGRRRRAEVYTHLLVIEVRAAGGDQDAADRRGCELLAAVDEAIADNAGLSGAVLDPDQTVVHCMLRRWRTSEGPWDQPLGMNRAFDVEIEVTARLL